MIFGCTPKESSTEQVALSGEQLIQRGQQIYKLNCIACHNVDPSKDGTTGPAVVGSNKELLTTRIIKASYPENYKPKRETKIMVAMPHLEKEILALEAYLNSK